MAQIPKPLLLIPLDQTTKTLGEAHDGFIVSLTKKIGVADKFGYPLLYSSFSTLATFTFTSSKTIDADFTISLHVKPTVLSTIKLISVPSQLTIEMDSLGKVKLRWFSCSFSYHLSFATALKAVVSSSSSTDNPHVIIVLCLRPYDHGISVASCKVRWTTYTFYMIYSRTLSFSWTLLCKPYIRDVLNLISKTSYLQYWCYML